MGTVHQSEIKMDFTESDQDLLLATDQGRCRSGSLLSTGKALLLPSDQGRSRSGSLISTRRGSLLLIDGRGGSLIQVPGQQIEVRRGSIMKLLSDDVVREEEEPVGLVNIGQFSELTQKQSENLAEQILYKGQYRILNVSVIFITCIIVFGIVFMSAWDYYDKTHERLWVLYVVLGVVLVAIGINLVGVKFYFMSRRYHGGS